MPFATGAGRSAPAETRIDPDRTRRIGGEPPPRPAPNPHRPRRTPASPWAPISRSTVQRATGMPSRLRCAQTWRGAVDAVVAPGRSRRPRRRTRIPRPSEHEHPDPRTYAPVRPGASRKCGTVAQSTVTRAEIYERGAGPSIRSNPPPAPPRRRRHRHRLPSLCRLACSRRPPGAGRGTRGPGRYLGVDPSPDQPSRERRPRSPSPPTSRSSPPPAPPPPTGWPSSWSRPRRPP